MSFRTPLQSLPPKADSKFSSIAERYARTVRLVRIEVIAFDSSRPLFFRFIWVILTSCVRSLFVCIATRFILAIDFVRIKRNVRHMHQIA